MVTPPIASCMCLVHAPSPCLGVSGIYQWILQHQKEIALLAYMCVDLQTISEFWRMQTHPKSLKMKFGKTLEYIPQELLPHILEVTLTGWSDLRSKLTVCVCKSISRRSCYECAWSCPVTHADITLTPDALVSLLDDLTSLRTLTLEEMRFSSARDTGSSVRVCICVLLYYYTHTLVCIYVCV